MNNIEISTLPKLLIIWVFFITLNDPHCQIKIGKEK